MSHRSGTAAVQKRNGKQNAIRQFPDLVLTLSLFEQFEQSEQLPGRWDAWTACFERLFEIPFESSSCARQVEDSRKSLLERQRGACRLPSASTCNCLSAVLGIFCLSAKGGQTLPHQLVLWASLPMECGRWAHLQSVWTGRLKLRTDDQRTERGHSREHKRGMLFRSSVYCWGARRQDSV